MDRFITAAKSFLLYSPLNQGLKPALDSFAYDFPNVFTLQSIKSRIETDNPPRIAVPSRPFLLYSPLNQGLKHCLNCAIYTGSGCFYSTVH